MPLSDSEKERYSRQLLLENWNQEKLKNAVVLVAGVGGLGCSSALYLAAAGVGTLRLCDGGFVDLPDLNRQIVYDENSLGLSKVAVVKQKLQALNAHLKVETFPETLDRQNIGNMCQDCDLIIDGLDNMEGRFILNGKSIRQQIPYVYGAVQGWQGFASFFHPPRTACLGCLMPNNLTPPPVIPVAGPLPGIIALIQATEALKYLMSSSSTLAGRLLIYDARDLTFTNLQAERKNSCPHCG